jgi:hypothetical protein
MLHETTVYKQSNETYLIQVSFSICYNKQVFPSNLQSPYCSFPFSPTNLSSLRSPVGFHVHLPFNVLTPRRQFLNLHISTLKMEATCSAEMSVSVNKVLCQNSEHQNLKIDFHASILTSYLILLCKVIKLN